MGTITPLQNRPQSVAALFRQLADEAASGKISGAIVVSEYEDEITLDIPGNFSQEVGSLSQIIGHLQIASTIFSSMAALPEQE
jgi:hypothetical protein